MSLKLKKRIKSQIYKLLVPPGSRVLEIGCARGDLLASLNPALGVGVDFSKDSIRHAKLKHPELSFFELDAHEIDIDAAPILKA